MAKVFYGYRYYMYRDTYTQVYVPKRVCMCAERAVHGDSRPSGSYHSFEDFTIAI